MSVNYNWFDDEMCDVAHELAVANYTAADFRNIEQLKEYAHERVKDELIKWCQLWNYTPDDRITDELVDDWLAVEASPKRASSEWEVIY